MRGVNPICFIGTHIEKEDEKQWLLRKLQEKLEGEGIRVEHEFEKAKQKERKNHKPKIKKSYYSIELS